MHLPGPGSHATTLGSDITKSHLACSPSAPLPVSPLPCLYHNTVWLVLWLVTVLQGPCQRFVRESAGLALFRSLTVPLLGSVPSCCCCLTLRCLFFHLFGLAVLADASTAFANVSPCFTSTISSGPKTMVLSKRERGCCRDQGWRFGCCVSSRALGIVRHEWAISLQSFLSAKWNPHYPNLQKPVDRSLDMRALGGAITSPCSNDTGYPRPPPTIFGLNTFYYAVVGLLFNLNIVSKGTLWETARITLCLQMACTVVT